MADTINDGGPALPTENAMQTGPSSCRYEGMTMRDYFATHASDKDLQKWLDSGFCRADARFKHADAMLKARDGR